MSILTKFKDLAVESIRDNWKLIVVFYVIFIIVFAATWIVSADVVSSNIENLTGAMNATPSGDTAVNSEDALSIFVHNELGGLMTYLGSVFFAIAAIVMLLYNAANLGATGPLLSAVSSNGGLRYLVYLIPHGIFEITATVLESVAGILLFMFIFRFLRAMMARKGASGAFEENKKVLIQSLVIIVISTILLLVAAPIEAYFSVPFSELIVGV